MTILAPEKDLELLLIEEAEHASKCDFLKCTKEAVYIASLRREKCDCEPHVSKALLCLTHATEFGLYCVDCRKPLTIVSLEPIKR